MHKLLRVAVDLLRGQVAGEGGARGVLRPSEQMRFRLGGDDQTLRRVERPRVIPGQIKGSPGRDCQQMRRASVSSSCPGPAAAGRWPDASRGGRLKLGGQMAASPTMSLRAVTPEKFCSVVVKHLSAERGDEPWARGARAVRPVCRRRCYSFRPHSAPVGARLDGFGNSGGCPLALASMDGVQAPGLGAGARFD